MTKCELGTQIIYSNQYCSSCPDTTFPAGSTAIHREYCEACTKGNHLVGTWCVSNTACTKGTHFINAAGSYSVCSACERTEKVDIGTLDIERDYCLACTTKPRFWIGEYCYRCDSPETPDVTSTDEEKSCRTCDVREVKDGKCVLVQ